MGGIGMTFPMYRDLRARQEVFTDILASDWGANSMRLTIPAGNSMIRFFRSKDEAKAWLYT
jgi:hypothetical protein